MASSSAHKPLLHHGATAAPPPTPSSQPDTLPTTSDSTADALASLLHRLPASLSLPSSRFGRHHSTTTTAATSTTPTIPLSHSRADLLSSLAAAASSCGFFQLTQHRLISQLAESAESDSASLFSLSLTQKLSLLPPNWPIGFEYNDEFPSNEENNSFCLDLETLTSIKSNESFVTSLIELTLELERLGGEVVEMLTCALGLVNPCIKTCSLMWVSKLGDGKMDVRCYPYIVALSYQIRTHKYRLDTDSGPVLVEPNVGSVLVTLGDIAQVWSNGTTKKVRGRPIPSIHSKGENFISMSLLVTLPLDSTVSPLLSVTRIIRKEDIAGDEKKKELEDEDESSKLQENRVLKFNSIEFEDYAWRVYHERLFLKDSLDRYRILCD